MLRGAVLWFALVLAACAPDVLLADMQPGEKGRVVRVIDGDALVLDTGQSVRLVSIEAPALRPRGREPDRYAVESARALEDMVLGREVQLFYPGITRDRYDRALAHVVTIDGSGPQIWLNRAMIEAGAARVRLYPDTAARGDELLRLEAESRAARQGLWKLRDYGVQPARALGEDTRGFMLVEAVLGPALAPEGDFAPRLACQRPLEGSVVRLEVRREAETACALEEGARVLLRGYVSRGRIDLTYPRHIEVLGADD